MKWLRVLWLALLFAMVSDTGRSQDQLRPIPLDPTTAILDAFTQHPVVALGEGDHGNRQGLDFRVRLIRDPRFAARVQSIVVETGNAFY